MLFIYYSFLIEFNSRQLDVGNYNSNDERLCNLLNISKRVNKSYLSVTTRYNNMAINNGWLNNDGSIWPIDVVTIGAAAELLYTMINIYIHFNHHDQNDRFNYFTVYILYIYFIYYSY